MTSFSKGKPKPDIFSPEQVKRERGEKVKKKVYAELTLSIGKVHIS